MKKLKPFEKAVVIQGLLEGYASFGAQTVKLLSVLCDMSETESKAAIMEACLRGLISPKHSDQ